MATDVNLSNSECIVSMTEWGQATVHNICSNTVTSVPWGTIEYAAYSGAVLFFGSMGLLFIGFLFSEIKHRLFGYY